MQGGGFLWRQRGVFKSSMMVYLLGWSWVKGPCVCVCLLVHEVNRKGSPLAGVEGEGQWTSGPGGRRQWVSLEGELEVGAQSVWLFRVGSLSSFKSMVCLLLKQPLVFSFQEEN